MPVRKQDIPDDVLAAFAEPTKKVTADVPDEVLAAFGDSKKKVVTGGASVPGTQSISPSKLPLSSEEVAKGVFSFGQFRDKKRPLPANIPRTERDISEVLKAVHFGAANPKQLTELYNDANGKEVATAIIKQFVPEATDTNINNPAVIESAAKNIKKQNRINFVNAEKEGIVHLDNDAKNLISDFNNGLPEGQAGNMRDNINELRKTLNINDLENNDELSNAITKIEKINQLQQNYILNDKEREEAVSKSNSLLSTLNNRLYYNISRTGVSPTINQLDEEINQAVITKVLESERGEDVNGTSKDQVKTNQFKLGLTAIEKTDPVLFKNVVNGISQLKKVSDSDFSNISKIGQQIDNQTRFRGAAYDPNLIDTETNFEYDTFGQKKAAAAGAIGEWMKSKGYKNMNQFPEKLIRQAAKETGVENLEIVNSLVFDEKLGGYDAIPKSGWLDDIVRGIDQPLEGINSTLNSWSESPVQTYQRSKSLSGTFGSQKVPDKSGQYSDILSSEHSFTTDMFRGLGQFIPQILLTKGVGGGLKEIAGLGGATLSAEQAKNVVDYGGTFVSTFLQSYGPAYEEHLQKTGDSGTAALIGTIDGISSAAFEEILPDVKIAGKAFDGLKQGLANDLIGLVRKGGDPAELLTKARPLVSKFFKNATNTLAQENLEELGTQYVDFVTESIFDPKSAKDRNINKELWDTFKSTTAAMILPSIMGATGGSFTKDFTTKSLHSAAINLDSYKESLQNSLDKEYISQEDYNKSLKILETHKQSIASAPDVNANGQTLAPEKKLDYALEDTKIKVYKAKAEQTEGVAKEMWEEKIKQAENIQREILMPKESPATEAPIAEETVAETPAAKAAPVVPTDEQLFDKVYEKGLPINNTLIPDNKAESISVLKDQALSTPSNINDKLGNDEELTTDFIAANGVEKINTQIQALTDQQKNPETTDQQTEEIDKHLSLLDKALEKATILESKTNTDVSQEAKANNQTEGAKETSLLNQENAVEPQQKTADVPETHEQIMKRGKTGEPITFSAYRIEKSDQGNEKTGTFFGDKAITEEYKRRNDTDFYKEGGKPEDRRFGGKINQYDITFKNPLVVRSQEQFVRDLALAGDQEAIDVMPNHSAELQPHQLETTHTTHEEFDSFVAKKAREKGYDGIITPLEYISLTNDSFKKKSTSQESTKPKIRVSAQQVEDAQPQKPRKVDRKALSDQLRKLLGNDAAALIADTDPHNRISFKDIGLEKGDNIETAIQKAINYGGEYTDLLKIIQADANLKNITLELVDSLENNNRGLYHPVGHGEGKDGLLQLTDKENVLYSLVHEAAHFLTLDSQVANSVKDTDSYKGIEELYNYIAAKKGKPIPGQATLENYALTNVKEFMAEMFINPTFRKYVSDVFEENKGDILKLNNRLRDNKVNGITEMISNFFRDLFNKLFSSAKSNGLEIDASKSVIDNAVKLATDLFLGGQDLTANQTASEGAAPVLGIGSQGAAALALPAADKNKPVANFIKTSLENGATIEDIKGALIDNGFSEEEAQKLVDNAQQKQKSEKQKVEQRINDIGKNTEDVLLDSVEHRRDIAADIAVKDTATADKLKLELVQEDANAFIDEMKQEHGKQYLNKTLSAISGINKNRVNLDKVLAVGIALENEINDIKDGFTENEFNISRSQLNKVYAQIQKINVENARISSKALNTIKTLYNNYESPIAKESILTKEQSMQKEAIMETVLNEERLAEAADAHETGVQLTEQAKEDVSKKETRTPKKITEKGKVKAKINDILTDLKDKLNKLDC